jgi:hypothetical protein
MTPLPRPFPQGRSREMSKLRSVLSDPGGTTECGVVEVSNARPPRGRPFAPVSERELYPTLRSLARKLPGADRGVLLVSELVGPFGVADLVTVVGQPELLAERLSTNVPPLLSEVDCMILAACKGKAVRKEEISAIIGKPLLMTQRRIAKLVTIGAVESNVAGKIKCTAYIRPVGRIWALEAKMRSWDRALAQSLRYSLWADGSVAVLSHIPNASAAAAKQRAEVMGLGLTHRDKWLQRAKIQKHSESRRLWASEHVVAAIVGITGRLTSQN